MRKSKKARTEATGRGSVEVQERHAVERHYDESEISSPAYEAALLLGAVQEVINTLVTDSGLSRKELAERLDLTPGRVSQICSGDNMTLRTLAHVGHALGYRFNVSARTPGDLLNADRIGYVNSDVGTVAALLQDHLGELYAFGSARLAGYPQSYADHATDHVYPDVRWVPAALGHELPIPYSDRV